MFGIVGKARWLYAASALAIASVGSGCGVVSPAHPPGIVNAVGAENEYANVIHQIGGRYVDVTAIMNNPNTDPHSFEASPRDARDVGLAQIVVQNGLGYDSFMTRLEQATPSAQRTVIQAGRVLHLPSEVQNPHVFYMPGAMDKVAEHIAQALEKIQPQHRVYFARRLAAFQASLAPWQKTLAKIHRQFPGAPVAVTEPVADYMLQGAGLDVKTPWSFQAAVMNSTDPSPEAAAQVRALLQHRDVKVLVYNQQAVDSTTEALLTLARNSGVPVVGVYETMPAGHTYQSWMQAEATAVFEALKTGRSSLTM